MNTVKFYHRDTGNMRPVRIVQGRPQIRLAKYQPLTVTEKAMAHAGYALRERLSRNPVAIVVDNNQAGSRHIVEAPPNVTLDIGTELFRV